MSAVVQSDFEQSVEFNRAKLLDEVPTNIIIRVCVSVSRTTFRRNTRILARSRRMIYRNFRRSSGINYYYIIIICTERIYMYVCIFEDLVFAIIIVVRCTGPSVIHRRGGRNALRGRLNLHSERFRFLRSNGKLTREWGAYTHGRHRLPPPPPPFRL